MRRAVLNWSGGKDSAMSLHRLRAGREYEVTTLLTTVTEEEDRILTHGVRLELLHRQAAALELPLRIVHVPAVAGADEYANRHEAALRDLMARGIGTAVFGDLFLQDVREYREKNLAKIGMRGVFPLWKDETAGFMEDVLRLGIRSLVVCVDTDLLDEEWLGREVDATFLADLPEVVDPAGENGEFHTFVFDGPMFVHPIMWEAGDLFGDGRHAFLDLKVPDDQVENR